MHAYALMIRPTHNSRDTSQKLFMNINERSKSRRHIDNSRMYNPVVDNATRMRINTN